MENRRRSRHQPRQPVRHDPEPTYAGARLVHAAKVYPRPDASGPGRHRRTARYRTTNRPGARFGPRAVRAASTIMAWERPYGMEFDPVRQARRVDYGDCYFDFGRPETVPDAIQAHAASIIQQGPGSLSIGGDHFVSFPLLKAYAEKLGAPISLLHFDAHSDTWDDDDGRIDHGTMFFHAAKQGWSTRQRPCRSGCARAIRTRWDSTSSTVRGCTNMVLPRLSKNPRPSWAIGPFT